MVGERVDEKQRLFKKAGAKPRREITRWRRISARTHSEVS